MKLNSINSTAKYNIIMLFVLVIVIMIMSNISPYFFSFRNLLDSTRLGSEIGIVALGMSLVILLGGIDLSVGSMFALSSIVFGYLFSLNFSFLPAALITILVGSLLGAVNGYAVSKFGLPAFLVTLSTMGVYRGLSIGFSKGNAYPVPEYLNQAIGEKSLIGIPLQFIIFLLGVGILVFLFRRTTMGRMFLVTGNNEVSAKFSGVNVQTVKTLIYTLSGLFSSVAAILFCSRVISAKADYGKGYELDAITIVVLGGATLQGGKINPLGTLLGMLVIILTRRGLTMALIPAEVQTVLIGTILIVAVVANSDIGKTWFKKKK